MEKVTYTLKLKEEGGGEKVKCVKCLCAYAMLET